MAGYFFGCPHCRAKLEARDASRAGRTVTCPKCEQAVIIPPPPKMGVPLDQVSGGASAPAADEAASQIAVNQDPGFKRGMSPAKAYSENESLPVASSSGFDKLPPMGSLEMPETHTVEASDDIEGYSFTIPEKDSGPPPLPAFKPKKVKPRPEEAPHPFEDPKYQLAALIAVVALIVVIGTVWSWLKGSQDDKDKPAEVAAPETPRPPSPPPSAPPPGSTAISVLPGADPTPAAPATPIGSTGLPGAAAPAPPPDADEAPGAVPNVLPEEDSTTLPGAAPRPLPDSTPNVVPKSDK